MELLKDYFRSRIRASRSNLSEAKATDQPHAHEHRLRPEPPENQVCEQCEQIIAVFFTGAGNLGVGKKPYDLNIRIKNLTGASDIPACSFCQMLRLMQLSWKDHPSLWKLRKQPQSHDFSTRTFRLINPFYRPWPFAEKAGIGYARAQVLSNSEDSLFGWQDWWDPLACDTIVEISPPLRLIDPLSIDFALAKTWVDNCRTKHATCCETFFGVVASLRLLDCYNQRLVQPCESVEYVALSYVWGREKDDRSKSLQVGDTLEEPPRLIKDAVQITERLGFRYLWVDRYCIPQNDAEARHSQICQMDLVYNMAQVTIVAAAGASPSHGLLGVSKPRTQTPHARVGDRNFAVFPPAPADEMGESPWAKRAWTYQEAFLSRRCLVFTQHQMFFKCASDENYEYSAERLNDTTESPSSTERADSNIDILEYITEYTSRAVTGLTYQSDALNGMLGILRTLETKEPSRPHLWGVPILSGYESVMISSGSQSQETPQGFCDGFIRGLCWRLQDPASRRAGFPSWSWAGWKGRVKQHSDQYGRTLRGADMTVFLQGGCKLTAAEDIGRVTMLPGHESRFIYLEGSIIKFTTVKNYHRDPDTLHYRFATLIKRDGNIDERKSVIDLERSWRDDGFWLKLKDKEWIWQAIVLETPESEREEASLQEGASALCMMLHWEGTCFERVGWVHVPGHIFRDAAKERKRIRLG